MPPWPSFWTISYPPSRPWSSWSSEGDDCGGEEDGAISCAAGAAVCVGGIVCAGGAVRAGAEVCATGTVRAGGAVCAGDALRASGGLSVGGTVACIFATLEGAIVGAAIVAGAAAADGFSATVATFIACFGSSGTMSRNFFPQAAH